MDETPAGGHVDWRPWGPEAFAAASERDCPILLSVVVPWSPECRRMDRETYGEPRIAAHVDADFVPVRVDGDRFPTVRDRYTMGGFPSTVVLTPTGEVIAGATELGPDGFRGILDRVGDAWRERGADAGSVPRSLGEVAVHPGELDDGVERQILERVRETADREYGGWGDGPKFPLPPAIEFALVRDREHATRTLEAVRTHLRDTDDGGFYRYARHRDWSGARTAKLADANAALLSTFAHAYRYTGDEAYRETATEILTYLTTTLWTGEAVAASQAGTFTDGERQGDDQGSAGPAGPAVDPTVFADRNGLALRGFCTLARYTDDERASEYARRVREHLATELIDDGVVTRWHPASVDESGETVNASPATTDRGHQSPVPPQGLLIDQARVLGGLVASWSVLGEGGPAMAVADHAVATLQREDGAVVDGPPGEEGLLDRPLLPVDPMAELANGLITLAGLTGERRYHEAARSMLASMAGAADRMGVEQAGYAAAVARCLDPTVLAVGGPAGSDLHRAALRLADHEATVVPDADVQAGTAQLRRSGDVVGTATEPAALEALVTGENA